MVRYLTLGNGTKGAFLLCERWSCNEKCHVMFAYNFLLAMNRLANTCDKKVPCLWVWCLDWLNLFFKFIMCREGADMGRWIFFLFQTDAYPFASSSCTCAWVEPKRNAGPMGTKWLGFIPSRKPSARASENQWVWNRPLSFLGLLGYLANFQGLFSRGIYWF